MNQRRLSRIVITSLLSALLLAFGMQGVWALPASQGCSSWGNATWASANPATGYGFNKALAFNAGEVVHITFGLTTATNANVSIREPIGTIRVGPVNFTAGNVILSWVIPADGNYRIWAANEGSSDGTVSISGSCDPVPDPTPTLVPILPTYCNLDDGRINHNDCDASAVIYQFDDAVHVYAINPDSSAGSLVLNVPLSDIEAAGVPDDANLLLAEGVNPTTGVPISLWRLTTGVLQLNTYLSDSKPYVVAWYPESPWDYNRLE